MGLAAVPLRPAIPAFDLRFATAGPAGHRLISFMQTSLDFRTHRSASAAYPIREIFNITADV
jgi:hypothetical protein